jgi:hypothetical protein
MDVPFDNVRRRSPTKFRLIAAIIGFIGAIGLLFATAQGAPGDAVRVTTSFDVKYASAVLRQVGKVFGSGFGAAEAARVEQDINALKPDEPKVWHFTVQYKGKAEQLDIRALMDDLGMIDLDFAAGADSAPAVRAAVDGYLNGRGG